MHKKQTTLTYKSWNHGDNRKQSLQMQVHENYNLKCNKIAGIRF